MLGTVVIFDSFLASISQFDLEGHELKFMLMGDGFSPEVVVDRYSDISAQQPVGNGYAQQTLTNKAITLIGDSHYLTFDPVTITASGGTISAKFYAIYDNTLANKSLICYGYIDELQSVVDVTDGLTLTFTPNEELGFFRFSQV